MNQNECSGKTSKHSRLRPGGRAHYSFCIPARLLRLLHNGGVHLLDTCRMGNDPQNSVVNKFHRCRDVPNLFLCDGSSLVSSGRGQPTMTIMALAFRAAEYIGAAARNNEV